jgi:hypothetical protein
MENHLEGLPQYGVTLSGTPENPVIENRSGKTVIAYVVVIPEQGGSMSVHQILLTIHMPDGLPDGGLLRVHGNVHLNPAVPVQGPMESPAQQVSPGRPVSAVLQSVVFDDGQFVGANEHGAFELFAKRIGVIREVGLLAKAGAWDHVETLAKALTKLSPRPPGGEDLTLYFERLSAAARLVQERGEKGDAAAARLAEIYSLLPTLWK